MGWPADRKEAVAYLEKAYEESERRCCRVLRLNRSLYRRQPKKDEQAFLRMRIKEIAMDCYLHIGQKMQRCLNGIA